MPESTPLRMLLEPTRLRPKEEQSYQLWMLMHGVPQSDDYDMRGFYKAARDPMSGIQASINPNDGEMHYPDDFKLPNHRTFSTGSRYYDPATMPDTPKWEGGRIGNTDAESWTLRRPDGRIVEMEAPWVRRK